MSTGAPPTHPWGYGARLWADLVAEASGGDIVFDVVPHAAEAGDGGVLEFQALQEGRIDAAVGSSLVWADDIPVLGLFAVPCLAPNASSLQAVVESPIGRDMFAALQDNGLVPLAWGDAGAYVIASRAGELRRAPQFQELSLRVPPLAPLRQSLRELGVDTLDITFRQARLQMGLGSIDGTVARMADLNSEAALPPAYDTWTRWPCIAEPLIFAVSAVTWASWSQVERAVVEHAALEAAAAQMAAARAITVGEAGLLEGDGLVYV